MYQNAWRGPSRGLLFTQAGNTETVPVCAWAQCLVGGRPQHIASGHLGQFSVNFYHHQKLYVISQEFCFSHFWMFERWQMSLKSKTSQAGRGEVWASRGGGGTHQVSSYGVNFSFRWTWWLMVKVEFYCNIITGRLCAMVGSAKYQRASSLIFTSGHADNLLTTVRGPVTSSLLLALPTTDCTCIAQ